MDADGKNRRLLTNQPGNTFSWPAWSPDGQKIAFGYFRGGNGEIYVIDADGKNLQNLTDHPANDYSLNWFDPAFARPVSPASKRPTTWGWIKRTGK